VSNIKNLKKNIYEMLNCFNNNVSIGRASLGCANLNKQVPLVVIIFLTIATPLWVQSEGKLAILWHFQNARQLV